MSDRIVDLQCVLTTSKYGWSANMQRITQQRDSSQQQQQDNQPQVARQSTRQVRGKEGEERKKARKGEGERGRSEQEEKGREESESVRKGERGKEEGRDVEEEECKQVEKDPTGWTVVTRNQRQRKMTQIFVKVNGSKANPMEVNLTDDKVEDVMRQIQKGEDVYVTMHGKVLRRNEKLKSCGVSDGCTIQVTSRLQGGGKHKDKRSKVKKKQVTRQEPVRNGGPAILESEKKAVIWVWEETEEFRTIVENVSGGSDVDVERKMRYWASKLQERPGRDIMECGLRWAVEARRKERSEEKRQQEQEEQRRQARQEQSKQDKQVRFGDEEQFEETRAESTDEQKVTGGLAEVRTGRGSAGLVRGRDARCQADETSRKGKEKGNGGKGEHEGKGGGFGRKGKQQETREEEEERVRMAPNMGAGGSHLQAMSDPGEEENKQGEVREESGEVEQGETRRMRWAHDEDKEEEEEQETERERQEEAEGKKEQEQEGEGKQREKKRETKRKGKRKGKRQGKRS